MNNFPKCFKILSKPHKFCPGCGHGITLKELGFAIDELGIQKNTILGIDIGCSLLAWNFFDINTVQTHHGRTVPVISGYKITDLSKIGIAYLGDGGGYAIGLQSLITVAMRNDPITVILVNNTLYGMTGGQMAPTTMPQEITTTTPEGKKITEKGEVFLGPELLSALPNKKAFVARTIVSQPLMVRQTIKKALEHQINKKSFAFVEVLSMCPVNWKKDAKQSLNYLENEMQKYYKVGVLSGEK